MRNFINILLFATFLSNDLFASTSWMLVLTWSCSTLISCESNPIWTSGDQLSCACLCNDWTESDNLLVWVVLAISNININKEDTTIYISSNTDQRGNNRNNRICSWGESNPHLTLRTGLFYPLNYKSPLWNNLSLEQ